MRWIAPVAVIFVAVASLAMFVFAGPGSPPAKDPGTPAIAATSAPSSPKSEPIRVPADPGRSATVAAPAAPRSAPGGSAGNPSRLAALAGPDSGNVDTGQAAKAASVALAVVQPAAPEKAAEKLAASDAIEPGRISDGVEKAAQKNRISALKVPSAPIAKPVRNAAERAFKTALARAFANNDPDAKDACIGAAAANMTPIRKAAKRSSGAVTTAAKPVVQTKPRSATLVAKIDLSRQRMTISLGGEVQHSWKISSGRAGYHTPTGSYKPYRMHKMWYSRKYDNAPMPHSVFFRGGYAVHATNATGRLGRPASHGCIRLAPGSARKFYNLVRKHGKANTRISIAGSTPSSARFVAKRSRKPCRSYRSNRARRQYRARRRYRQASRRHSFFSNIFR